MLGGADCTGVFEGVASTAAGGSVLTVNVLAATFGIAVIVGKNVRPPIGRDTALKSDEGSEDVRMKFSSSSRVVMSPFFLVQCLEMIDSLRPGTYQIRLRMCTDDLGEERNRTYPLPSAESSLSPAGYTGLGSSNGV